MKAFQQRFFHLLKRRNYTNNKSCQFYSTDIDKPFYGAVVRSTNDIAIEELKPIHPSKAELLIRVDSAGINSSDLAMIAGMHYLRPEMPFTPGFELAGEVIGIGKNVKKFNIGDRICGLKTIGTGAFAQRCLIDESEAHKIPHKISYETGASMLASYGTALHVLKDILRVEEKGTILIVSAQGGTGLACIDIAQSVFKCKVIFASTTDKKCDVARQMGVLATVEYTDENMPKSVMKILGTNKVDYCIDTIGGAWFDLALKCIKPGGHLASVGFGGQTPPTISLETLMRNQLTITGVSLGARCATHKNSLSRLMNTIIDWKEEKYCSPKIALKFRLQNLSEAIAICSKERPLGKVILTCRDEDVDRPVEGEES